MLVYQRVIRHRRSGSKNLEMVTLLIRTPALPVESFDSNSQVAKQKLKPTHPQTETWLVGFIFFGRITAIFQDDSVTRLISGRFFLSCLSHDSTGNKTCFLFPQSNKTWYIHVINVNKPSPSHHHNYIGGVYIYICKNHSQSWVVYDIVLPRLIIIVITIN